MDPSSASYEPLKDLVFSLVMSPIKFVISSTCKGIINRIIKENLTEKVYERIIADLTSKFPNIDIAIFDDFLSRDNVLNEIENYLKQKDNVNSSKIFKDELLTIRYENDITIEDSESISLFFISILDDIIRENPSLQIYILKSILDEAKKMDKLYEEIKKAREDITSLGETREVTINGDIEIQEIKKLIKNVEKQLVTINQYYEDSTRAFNSFEESNSPKLDFALRSSEENRLTTSEQSHSISIFIPYETFFKPLTDNRKLFNHTLPLVGREDHLKKLDEFVNSGKKITLIYGRGGIGKTRLLLEFSRRFVSEHSDWDILFLCEGIRLSNNSLNMLPEKNCVIIADNAHSRDDILILCEIAQQAEHLVKIVLTCRPYGLDNLISTCMRGRFDIREIELMPEIKELNPDQTEQLAKLALDKEYHPYLESLLQAFHDSPLALVIGGRLIAECKINPYLLESNKQFQDTILGRFQEDQIFEKNAIESDDYFTQDLLSLISAFAPIQNINEFSEIASKFIGVKKSKLIRSIDILEKRGILINTGSKLRITPKVLSGYILCQSCLTSSKNLTEYIDEIFDEFGDKFLKNLLYNLSELEWRIQLEDNKIDLLNKIWGSIENDFKEGSNNQRLEIVEIVDKVAYFTPKRTLSLIKYALNNPIITNENDVNSFFYHVTHQNLLTRFPLLLRKIALREDYLLESCDLLWKIGASKDNKSNYFSDDVLKILIDLTEYDLYKPFEFNSLMFEFIERKMKYIEDLDFTIYLLDILDPLLKKDGLAHRSTGFKITSIPFIVPYEKTKEIRKKAISLIEININSKSTKISLRALNSLTTALNPPNSYFGKTVTDDEINMWLPEQILILNILENISKTTADWILKIQIKSSLLWHAKKSNQSEVAEKARSIIDSIPETFEIRFLRAFWSNYHWDFQEYEEYEEYIENVNREIKEVVKEFLEKYNYDGQNVFDFLNKNITNFEINSIQINPHYFLSILSFTNSKIATEICNYILSDTSKPLAIYFDSLLIGIKETNNKKAITIIKAAINSKDPILCRSIAKGYAHRGWALKLSKEEIEIIYQLLDSLEAETKELAVESLRNFPESMMDEALELTLSVEIGNNEKLADKYCSIFDSKHGISLDKIDDEKLKLILQKMAEITRLSDELYHLNLFLTYCSNRIPEDVVDFLLNRLNKPKNKEFNVDNRYQPLPFGDFHGKGLYDISSSPNYKNILRKVRDKSLYPDLNGSFWLPKLFSDVSNNFSPESLEVLNEWINSGENDKIKAVGQLLRKASSNFMFLNPEFVSNLLEKSYITSDECYQQILLDLSEPCLYGPKTGFAGQPCPKDEEVKDQAKTLMENYPIGSPTRRFYEYIYNKSLNSIQEWLNEDKDFD